MFWMLRNTSLVQRRWCDSLNAVEETDRNESHSSFAAVFAQLFIDKINDGVRDDSFHGN